MRRSTLFALPICVLLVCTSISFSQEGKPLSGVTFSGIEIDTSLTGHIRLPAQVRGIISSEFVYTLLQHGARLNSQGEPIQLLFSARSTSHLASKLQLPSKNLVVKGTVEMMSFDGHEWIGVLARDLISKLARQYETHNGIAGK